MLCDMSLAFDHSTIVNLSTACDIVMINSVKLLWRHMIPGVLFSRENHRCSYTMLIFSIQMAMAIIMLIYVNLSSDTIT